MSEAGPIQTLIYGLAKGEKRAYMESLLATKASTPAEIALVKSAASKDGWHSFRVAKFQDGKPDFVGTLQKGKRGGIFKKSKTGNKVYKRK